MNQDLDIPIDLEMKNRFYKRRDISQEPQSNWLIEIFKQSMNVRIFSIGISTSLFTLFCFVLQVLIIIKFRAVNPEILARKEIYNQIKVLQTSSMAESI